MKTISIWLFLILFVFQAQIYSQINTSNKSTFQFKNTIKLPGTPEFIYDNLTGDISLWWDHSFVKNPYKLYIDAKPGGGFYELFDSLENGAKHADVIYADRGKILRMDGPLGLSGSALQIVTTYKLEAIGNDSTQLNLEVHASGEMEENTDEIVEQVWKHFLEERFKAFIEAKF